MGEIEVRQADVTRLELDAIANAANTELCHGGSVAAAIARAGGPEIQAESDQRAPIGLGEAVETTAGKHVVFAVHGDEAREAFERALAG